MARKKRRKKVDDVFENLIEAIVQSITKNILSGDQAPLPKQQAKPDPFLRACLIVGVAPDTPLKIAEAVYKTKAKFIHPDRGGDKKEFQRLNAAIEIIRRHHGS